MNEPIYIVVGITILLFTQILMWYGYLYFRKRKTTNGFRKLKKEIKQRIKEKQITEVLNEIIKENKKEQEQNGNNENNKINK